MRPEELKQQIIELTKQYSNLVHKSSHLQKIDEDGGADFEKGVTTVPYSGRVFNENEVAAAVGATLDFWLTLGKNGEAFEKKLASYMRIRHSILVNSGSSANLLAVSALSSHKLEEKRLKKGDEIITVAAGFPTTVAPIIQNGFVPVFVDNDPVTSNINVSMLEEAYSPGKTRAVILAHSLGNPFDIASVKAFCDKYGLWLIEDNCDALGSLYDKKLTGTYGDLSTQSFYPAHQLTLGEGGAVNVVKNAKLKVIIESFRDWGRDCWCASGCDNTCGKRFEWQLGELPDGYDHKYIYSHWGYNLKPLDIQAAIGIEQLQKLPDFINARVRNWNYLRKGLDDLSEYFTFMLPTHAEGWNDNGFVWDKSGHTTTPCWFGFMLRINPTAPFSKFDLASYLEERKIGNRSLFGGNLTRQPAFINLKNDQPDSYRIIGDLKGADTLMKEALFIGIYPGLSKKMLDYIIETIHEFVSGY